MLIRPNKNTGVFQVTGLKILDRVGTHFFYQQKCAPFKMHKIIFFPQKT